MRVPTADDLRVIELETLIATDFWQRVHITVSLETQSACMFVARLYRAEEEECEDFAAAKFFYDRFLSNRLEF